MEWIKGLIPFLAPYPLWVKIAFCIAIAAAAVGIVGLIVAAPGPSTMASSDVYLTIKNISLVGPARPIRLKAIVNPGEPNSRDYLYPNVPGVNYVMVGPDMGPETYTLSGQTLSTISFEIYVSDGAVLKSTENQAVSSDGTQRIYNVRQVVEGVKSDVVGGVVTYQVSKARI